MHQKFIYESSFGMNVCQLSGNPLAYDLMNEVLKVTTDIDYKLIASPSYKNILEIDTKIIDALLERDSHRACFLSTERDLETDKIIDSYDDILNKDIRFSTNLELSTLK